MWKSWNKIVNENFVIFSLHCIADCSDLLSFAENWKKIYESTVQKIPEDVCQISGIFIGIRTTIKHRTIERSDAVDFVVEKIAPKINTVESRQLDAHWALQSVASFFIATLKYSMFCRTHRISEKPNMDSRNSDFLLSWTNPTHLLQSSKTKDCPLWRSRHL